MLVVGVGVAYAAEQNGSPAQHAAGIDDERRGRRPPAATSRARSSASGSPPAPSGRRSTTAASNGSVNSALDSYTGLGGAVPLANMMTGEVIFGGVGSGLYGMLLFVLLAVFIAGLMVGRTPEYLGKKIEAREMKLVMIGALVVPLLVLVADRDRGRDPVRRRRRSSTRARRASRRRSTPTPRRPTTTAPRSPATPASSSRTRRATRAPTGSRSPTCSAALAMLFGRFVPMLAALAVGRRARRQAGRARRARHVPHRHARPSSCC